MTAIRSPSSRSTSSEFRGRCTSPCEPTYAARRLASSDIVLVASHTHNGPVIGRTLDPFITYDMGPAELALVDAYTEWLAGSDRGRRRNRAGGAANAP